MIFKIDLKKAFDRLEWSFIRQSFWFFNFPPRLIRLITSCIFTSSIFVLVNDSKTSSFFHQGKSDRGDLMSPYLSILCIELLSRKIDSKVDTLQWNPIFTSKRGPTTTLPLSFLMILHYFPKLTKITTTPLLGLLRVLAASLLEGLYK